MKYAQFLVLCTIRNPFLWKVITVLKTINLVLKVNQTLRSQLTFHNFFEIVFPDILVALYRLRHLMLNHLTSVPL